MQKFPIIHREKSPPAESKSGSAEDGRAPAVSVKQKFTQTKQKRKEADDTGVTHAYNNNQSYGE